MWLYSFIFIGCVHPDYAEVGNFFSKVLYQLDEKRAAHYIKNKDKTFIKDLNNSLQITAAATPRDPLRAPILLSVVLVLIHHAGIIFANYIVSVDAEIFSFSFNLFPLKSRCMDGSSCTN